MTRRWKIVSGGQTGVDRAALDAARMLGLEHGGCIPRGRRTEDGALPDDYAGMVETPSRNYSVRTRRNVAESDATLVLTRGAPDGGTRLTLEFARERSKPILLVDLAVTDAEDALARIGEWLDEVQPGVLNVAGPRESRRPGIEAEARALLERLLRDQA